MCSLSADSSPKYAENMNDPSSQTGELWANGEKKLNSVKRVWKWRKFAKKYIETKKIQISDLDPPPTALSEMPRNMVYFY